MQTPSSKATWVCRRCSSGTIGIEEDPKKMPIIRSSHYYWVGGPPKVCLARFKSRLNQPFSAFGTQ